MYSRPTVLAEPILAALNPTLIAYIADMLSKQVGQQDKDVEFTCVVTKP